MLFAHVLRDMSNKIVILHIATVVRDCEILFSITKDTCDELIQLSEMFEKSVSNADDNISPEEEETVTTDLSWTGCTVLNESSDDDYTEERSKLCN